MHELNKLLATPVAHANGATGMSDVAGEAVR